MKPIEKGTTAKGIASKNKIFEAFILLMQTENYEKITIRQICQSANISIGQFYHHFKSKNDILFDYIRMEEEDIYAFYNTLPVSPVYETLLRTFEYQFKFFQKKGARLTSLLLTFENFYSIGSFRVSDSTIYRITSDSIKKGQELGEFSTKYSHDFLVECFINQLVGLTYYWITSGQNCDVNALLYPKLKQFADILLLEDAHNN